MSNISPDASSSGSSTESIGSFQRKLSGDGFKIGDKIAEGSFGAVYKATYQNKQIAVKIIDLSKMMKNSNRMLHFKQELEALSKLHHPHIIKMLKHYQNANSKAYMFLELAEKDSI